MGLNNAVYKKIILNIAIFMMFFMGISFLLIKVTWALQPVTPEQIKELRDEGKYEIRLENALRIGNHKVRPHLVEKFKIKAERLFLKSLGLPTLEMDKLAATLPPGREGGLPSIGSPKIFALLIEFQDETHNVDSTDIDDMLFGDGDVANFPRESLTAYYDRASYGMLDLSGGTTLGWYKTSYDRTTVTQDSTGREDLIKEALDKFNTDGHDFSQYDNDGDGDIEYFIVLWAGPNGAWATFWWAWNLGWNDSTYTIDGKTLSNYSWQRESDNPTVVVHETGHSLGLPDLYDYDETVGPGAGVGGFDPMDSNLADPNCFWKWMLGWVTPRVVFETRQNITLDDTTTTEDCVLIWPEISLSGIFGEFYMVQNRQAVENDDGLWFTPDGLAVWHIDATLDSAGTNFEYNNSTTDHKLIRLMEADGLEEIEGFDCCRGCSCQIADSGDLYGVGVDFGPATTPSSDKYDGTDSCVRVWNVVDDGIGPGDMMTADYSTICNTPPVSDANGPYTVECQGATTSLALNGIGSYDHDAGDIITYFWSTDCPAGTMDDVTFANPNLTLDTPDSNIPVNCNVELTVTDKADDIDSDSSTITVNDTIPPNITCPADITIECDQSSGPDNTGSATATDLCSPVLDIVFSDIVEPGTCPGEETIERTWSATDTAGNQNSCMQTIEVVDTTPPIISCNSPAIIKPPDAPISFTSTAVDNCDESPSVVITDYDCYTYTKKGKRIDKTGSCVVDIAENQITVLDSGGVNDHISWTIEATDGCGNISTTKCEVLVVNPAQ